MTISARGDSGGALEGAGRLRSFVDPRRRLTIQTAFSRTCLPSETLPPPYKPAGVRLICKPAAAAACRLPEADGGRRAVRADPASDQTDQRVRADPAWLCAAAVIYCRMETTPCSSAHVRIAHLTNDAAERLRVSRGGGGGGSETGVWDGAPVTASLLVPLHIT